MRTILVPLDGSQFAEKALGYAEFLVKATSAELVLCRALPVDLIQPADDDFAMADEARGYLRHVASRLEERGCTVTTLTDWGSAAGCILEHVRGRQADLVVMSTHGRSAPGRWLYGSVADEVMRGSPVPVALIPPAVSMPAAARAVGLTRVLVPLDGSERSETALPPAMDVATTLGAEILLLAVVPFPPYSLYDDGTALVAFAPETELTDSERYLADVAARVQAAGIKVTTRALVANPAIAIAQVAAAEHADAIVMATHGRTGMARMVLGSVAMGTLQRTGVPLLLVGPAAKKVEEPRSQVELLLA
jgi:nucleotide-binding universal stress UspA family protein